LYLIGHQTKLFVGQDFRHLNKFHRFCPVKQPEDAKLSWTNL